MEFSVPREFTYSIFAMASCKSLFRWVSWFQCNCDHSRRNSSPQAQQLMYFRCDYPTTLFEILPFHQSRDTTWNCGCLSDKGEEWQKEISILSRSPSSSKSVTRPVMKHCVDRWVGSPIFHCIRHVSSDWVISWDSLANNSAADFVIPRFRDEWRTDPVTSVSEDGRHWNGVSNMHCTTIVLTRLRWSGEVYCM